MYFCVRTHVCTCVGMYVFVWDSTRGEGDLLERKPRKCQSTLHSRLHKLQATSNLDTAPDRSPADRILGFRMLVAVCWAFRGLQLRGPLRDLGFGVQRFRALVLWGLGDEDGMRKGFPCNFILESESTLVAVASRNAYGNKAGSGRLSLRL